ncbi:hypothetical protein CMI47_18265 [Candidatus Pacearchaeota archaeon]|nr:hypothetical protein [Candidatus Pacearchaeota archaeon]
MTNQDPYISDSLDYIYLDIKHTSLEPIVDEYRLTQGHVIDSTEYISVLSSPELTYGRKYFVQCNFFVGGDEEEPYSYRILDGLGSTFPDGEFSLKNTRANGTGYEDLSNSGNYGSWFKVFYANSNSPIYFETKANGVNNNSSVYYVQFLAIDITDLKEDYHYFYREDSVYSDTIKTSYKIQPDEVVGSISQWSIMGNYSIVNPSPSTSTLRLYDNENFVYSDESGMDLENSDTNRPKVLFNNISVSVETNINLKHSSPDAAVFDKGNIYYPKIFGLRTDVFNDSEIFNSDSSFPLYECTNSSLLLSDNIETDDNEYFILGQISHDEVNTFNNKISSNFSSSISQVTAFDEDDFDRFGSSVSIYGSFAVIGSPRDQDNGFLSGSAYIYEHDGSDWNYVQKISASDGSTNDFFGGSVFIYEDMIFIGSSDTSNSKEGAVYFFKKESSTWSQVQKIKADNPIAFDYFGSDSERSPISCHNNTLVIGATGNDEAGAELAGCIYVFNYDGSLWTQSQQLFASDYEASANFGASVSVYDTTIVVGSHTKDQSSPPLINSGAVYVFDYDGSSWVESQIITANDSTHAGQFGHSVSLYKDIFVVGSPVHDHDAASTFAGSAYVYEKDMCTGLWVGTELLSSTSDAVDYFGWSVSIYDGIVAIGAMRYPGLTGPDLRRGAVWVYERISIGNWDEIEAIDPDDRDQADEFGYSVSIYGNTILSGSPLSEDVLTNSGSAFFCDGDLEPSATPHNGIGLSFDIVVDGNETISYPIDEYSIYYDTLIADPVSDFQKHSIRNQIIPFSMYVPSVNSSLSVEFNVYNNGLKENTTFKDLKYVILSNKVKKYSPEPVLLTGKSLKEIYPDMMICSYTNSGIDNESSILGGFDTEDPRNYVIDGLGNKLPFRWSSGVKDYHFNRGKIDTPRSHQEEYRVLSLGHIPERPHPKRADIFDIDEYDVLSATIYDDTNIALRSKYFENDVEPIDEVTSFYLILDKTEWYEGDGPNKIGIYKSYNDSAVDSVSPCRWQNDNNDEIECFIALNFTEWNLSSTEKKLFQVFTYNSMNAQDSDNNTPLRYWYISEIKPASNIDRITRHFNYEDVFIEDTVSDFMDLAPLIDYKFVIKSSTEDGTDGMINQSYGRTRSLQASDIFRDKEQVTLDGFLSKTEEDLRVDLEYQLNLDSTDPYLYSSVDTSHPHIYFYMPPDFMPLHYLYKLRDESLFNAEVATTTEWSTTTWTSDLFQECVQAISLRLKVLRSALINGDYSETFEHNIGSTVGLYSFRTNFYGDDSDIDIIGEDDYLIQKAYEAAIVDNSLLRYTDYLQVELFPRWGELDSYSDDDLNDFIDMHLEYCQKAIENSPYLCKMFPLVNHKVRNESSNSHLMVIPSSQLKKFINRIDHHIDSYNFYFWEYGIYNESDYDNYYTTPSSPTPSNGLGYNNEYIDSYPWTSDPLDPNGLIIDESLQPYIHGGSKSNTLLWCYYMRIFDEEIVDSTGFCD